MPSERRFTLWQGITRVDQQKISDKLISIMPSSVIGSYYYDPESWELTISYVSGAVYCYTEVPERVYKEFKSSISKGRYHNFNIKGKFNYKKVEAE